MTKNEHAHHQDTFWSGLSLGAIVGATGLALFGTKRGRELVQKMLDVTENFEESAAGLIQDLEKELDVDENVKAAGSAGANAIESLLDKIQSIMPEKQGGKLLK